jgi:hypothetical protein
MVDKNDLPQEGSIGDRMIKVVAYGRTLEGLPYVSKDTTALFLRDIIQSYRESSKGKEISDMMANPYFQKSSEIMRWENPSLYGLLRDFSLYLVDKDEEKLQILELVFVMGYELLRKQAEANKLEREMGN